MASRPCRAPTSLSFGSPRKSLGQFTGSWPGNGAPLDTVGEDGIRSGYAEDFSSDTHLLGRSETTWLTFLRTTVKVVCLSESSVRIAQTNAIFIPTMCLSRDCRQGSDRIRLLFRPFLVCTLAQRRANTHGVDGAVSVTLEAEQPAERQIIAIERVRIQKSRHFCCVQSVLLCTVQTEEPVRVWRGFCT